jgi:hypothetical protein
MQRHAIMFKIKPGTEEKVSDILAGYQPPEWTAPDGTRLLSTSVFIKDDFVIRVIEFDGSLPSLMAHLGRQPVIQEVERRLTEYLVEERDMSSPEGARSFFIKSLMTHVTTRVADRPEAALA